MADEKSEDTTASRTIFVHKQFRAIDSIIFVGIVVVAAVFISLALKYAIDVNQPLIIRTLSIAFAGIILGLLAIYIRKLNAKIQKFVDKYILHQPIKRAEAPVENSTKTTPKLLNLEERLHADQTPYAKKLDALEKIAAEEFSRQKVVHIVIHALGVDEYNKSVWNNYTLACRLYLRMEKNGLENFSKEELRMMATEAFGTEQTETGLKDEDLDKK
jgi:hypothetical protein